MTLRPASEFAQTSIPAPGIIGVDWEERVDFTRLRTYRTERARQALEASDLGALLVFESSNIRYLTATHIGTWGYNKTERWALLTRTGEPWVWDFGSAAKNHRMYSPWLLPEHSNGGNNGLQGAISPSSGLPHGTAQEIAAILREEGVADLPLGVDVVELPMLRELEAAGIDVRVFNSNAGGGHEFTVVGLAPGADPNDPSTWGPDARVVDGWTGRSLTP